MKSRWWRTDAYDWNSQGWSLQVRGDELADIRYHGNLVLRGIRAAVRDQGWRTVPVNVRSINGGAESLVLVLQHEGLGAQITSTLVVEAGADELSVTWDAVSETDFDTCRAGLVALHPPSDAGRSCVVEHSDGTREATTFPIDISPKQPMMDIAALQVEGGTRITFTGDVFEMEDQRNWTDASFKTYSRPLDLPYPYRLVTGERVTQAITLVGGSRAPLQDERDAIVRLVETGSFPEIGVEASTAPDPVAVSSAGTFRVVELDLTTPTWRAALRRAVRDEEPLDVRLVSDGDAKKVAEAADALRGLPVLRVAAFDGETHVTTLALADLVRRTLGDAGVSAPFAAGARSHFTELNREQSLIPRDADAITMTTTPLFHALDTEQLVEAVAMQRLVADQAVRIADGLDVHIGPVSLRPRFNNVATTPQAAPTRNDLGEGYGAEFTGSADDRQRADQLGAWVIASAAASAVPGVRSLSWFETWGPRGLEDASGRLPVADAVAALTDLVGSELLAAPSPDGLLWAIGGRFDGADVILIANLDSVGRTVTISLPSSSVHSVHVDGGCWKRVAR